MKNKQKEWHPATNPPLKIENPRTISGFYRIAGKIGVKVNPPSGCSRPLMFIIHLQMDTGEAPQSFTVPTFFV